MGPRRTAVILGLAASILAGDPIWSNRGDRPPTRKRSQKGRKRGFKARPKK